MSNCIIVQRLLINSNSALPDELYYIGSYRQNGNRLVIPAGGELLFRTYFNMFSARQWMELTGIRRVLFRLRLCGEGNLELWKADLDGESSLVSSVPFCFEDKTEILTDCFDLDQLDKACWLCVRAEKTPVTLYGGEILTDTPRAQNPKLACCFCTYKREKEILRNVSELLSGIHDAGSFLYNSADIYISDNGHTLTADSFPDSEHVFLFENRNYGGSAGFTRCMIEAAIQKKGQYSHLILMDDDALILSHVVERTALLLSFLKPEYQRHMIGGALLSIQDPWMQIENGGEFKNGKTLLNGYHTDLRDFGSVLCNQQPHPKIHVNYNAWFYACMPAGFITEDNLPLPFFLHGDDVEYSLRFHNRILRMNGICIWHPDPTCSGKAYMEYYNRRNYSVIDSLYNPEMTPAEFCSLEYRMLLSMLGMYRYDDVRYSIRGIRDFLGGVDHFLSFDAEELNRTIMNWIKTEHCQLSDPERQNFDIPLAKPLSRKQKLTSLLIPARTGRKLYDSRLITYPQVDYPHASEVCIADRATGNGFILRRDGARFRAGLKECCKLAFEILSKYPSAYSSWRDRYGELTSCAFWKKYLGLS